MTPCTFTSPIHIRFARRWRSSSIELMKLYSSEIRPTISGQGTRPASSRSPRCGARLRAQRSSRTSRLTFSTTSSTYLRCWTESRRRKRGNIFRTLDPFRSQSNGCVISSRNAGPDRRRESDARSPHLLAGTGQCPGHDGGRFIRFVTAAADGGSRPASLHRILRFPRAASFGDAEKDRFPDEHRARSALQLRDGRHHLAGPLHLRPDPAGPDWPGGCAVDRGFRNSHALRFCEPPRFQRLGQLPNRRPLGAHRHNAAEFLLPESRSRSLACLSRGALVQRVVGVRYLATP